MICEQDIKNVTLDSLRHNIGVVPQDCVLFNDTLLHNLAYGKLGATQEQIDNVVRFGWSIFFFLVTLAIHACPCFIRMAGLDAVISRMPQGYKTLVGERGLKLSGELP